MQKNKERTFIAILCNKGLIWIEDISNLDQKTMWAVLKGEEARTFSNDFKSLLVEIKARSGHMFEIYSITAVEGVKKSDILELFNNDPQHGMDVIREMGYKIYSDYETNEESIL